MKKSYTIPFFIFSIFLAILMIFLFVFVLKVIKNKNIHASVVITTLQEKIKEKENILIFEKKFSEIQLLQKSITDYFVDANKIDIFVNYLEETSSSVGSELVIKSIEIPPKTKNTISVKLSILGTFQEVVKTISLLENINYKINITQMYLNENIKKSSNGEFKQVKISGIPTWQADISFNVLSLN